MLYRALVLVLATASAFELPTSLSRRDAVRAIATAPLVAALPAVADSDNRFLGFTKSGLGAGQVDKYGAVTKSIGRDATIDEIGGAAVPSKALRSTAGEYAFKMTRPGEKEKNPAQQAALARLLEKK